MPHFQSTVIARRTLAPAFWEIRVETPGLAATAQPGQFFMAAGPGYLRRAVFPSLLEPDRLAFCVGLASDSFTAWLGARAPGDSLDLIGPLGHGFGPASLGEQWLLVGESAADVAALLPQMLNALAQGAAVLVLTGGVNAAAVFPARELPSAVELRVATRDGSFGRRGVASDLLAEALPWADRVCATGSRAFLRCLATTLQADPLYQARPVDSGFAQVLLRDVDFACGLGACRACAVHTGTGLRRVCHDGPVFDISQLGEALIDHD
jgi:dihydroorotate dehydrogenase electron transfer subunit